MAGSTPATLGRSTGTATWRSRGGRRRSSSPPAARTWRRPSSRTGCGRIRSLANAWRPVIGLLVTIDPEAFPLWKADHGKDEAATVADLRDDPDLLMEIDQAVTEANKAVSHACLLY